MDIMGDKKFLKPGSTLCTVSYNFFSCSGVVPTLIPEVRTHPPTRCVCLSIRFSGLTNPCNPCKLTRQRSSNCLFDSQNPKIGYCILPPFGCRLNGKSQLKN